jgi:hypothetical protein
MCADVDTRDFLDLSHNDVEAVTDAIQRAEAGQIVLFHDANGDEAGLKSDSVAPVEI